MLTKKQNELLIYINQNIRETGVAPSYEEMREALDLRSKSGIHRLISALEERGFIRRLPHRARAIEVTKLPSASSQNKNANFNPELIKGKKEDYNNDIFEDLYEIKMMGKIAAGTPIAAIEYEKNKISVPNHIVGSGEHYALEIEGDSMIGAGILDGATAIIKKADDAYSGEIIVALIDGEEATLKRLRKKGETIALEPANSAYETKIYGPDRVQVQGTLVGILRSY